MVKNYPMKMFLKLKKIVPKRNYSSLITEELGLDQVYPVKMSTFNEKSFPSTYYTTNLPNGIKVKTSVNISNKTNDF